jgi:hypothetical protein
LVARVRLSDRIRTPFALSAPPALDCFSMRRLTWAAPSVLLLLAACPPPPQDGEVVDIRRAEALARDDSVPVWPTSEAGRPVVLYVDRSQSMRGFLDPEYPTRVRTDYRSVLDGFDARLRPSQVLGFGNEVRPAEGGGLGVLGNKEFYSDANTELEEVFPRVRADSSLGASHVIIGDGRRTDPNSANAQYVGMRALAEWWITEGGTFIVAASHAPFKPVEADPSGCRGGAAASGQATCPLYAFAFVAPGDEGRVTAALAATFEDLFVTPFPALAATGAQLSAQGTAVLTLEPRWARAPRGTPIARVRGTSETNQPLRASIVVRDTASPLGRATLSALRGRRLVPQLSVRALADDSAAAPWLASPERGALLRPTSDPLAYEFFSRGPSAPRYLYRIELRPAGDPAWLERYDAEGASDAQRTYGLGRLFESFRARDPRASTPVVRLYAVVN